jgi:hypothetical protein
MNLLYLKYLIDTLKNGNLPISFVHLASTDDKAVLKKKWIFCSHYMHTCKVNLMYILSYAIFECGAM